MNCLQVPLSRKWASTSPSSSPYESIHPFQPRLFKFSWEWCCVECSAGSCTGDTSLEQSSIQHIMNTQVSTTRTCTEGCAQPQIMCNAWDGHGTFQAQVHSQQYILMCLTETQSGGVGSGQFVGVDTRCCLYVPGYSLKTACLAFDSVRWRPSAFLTCCFHLRQHTFTLCRRSVTAGAAVGLRAACG